MDQIEKLDEWIELHRDEMVQELKGWVSHPSVSRADLATADAPYGADCRKMLDYALERGAGYGFEVEDHKGYAGSIYFGSAKEQIGFICHLDVVPEGEGWIYEPYQPVEKNGFLIGRGVEDNKGAAVMVLFAFRFLKESGYCPRRQFHLLLGCAEETGMEDMVQYVQGGLGKVPDFSIVADTDFPACYAQKGRYNADLRIPLDENVIDFQAGNVRNNIPGTADIWLDGICPAEAEGMLKDFGYIEVQADGEYTRITAQGKGGHAAWPENRENAIAKLCRALTESGLSERLGLTYVRWIGEAFASPYGEGLDIDIADEQSGRLTINAGVIQRVEDHLVLAIDIRFPVSFTSGEIDARLHRAAERKGIAIEAVGTEPSYYIDPEDKKVQALMRIYRDITGDDTKPYAMGGGTYSRVVPNAISYGPTLPDGRRPDFLPAGHGSSHGPDETLNLEEWMVGFRIYVRTILELDRMELEE